MVGCQNGVCKCTHPPLYLPSTTPPQLHSIGSYDHQSLAMHRRYCLPVEGWKMLLVCVAPCWSLAASQGEQWTRVVFSSAMMEQLLTYKGFETKSLAMMEAIKGSTSTCWQSTISTLSKSIASLDSLSYLVTGIHRSCKVSCHPKNQNQNQNQSHHFVNRQCTYRRKVHHCSELGHNWPNKKFFTWNKIAVCVSWRNQLHHENERRCSIFSWKTWFPDHGRSKQIRQKTGHKPIKVLEW